MPASTSEIHHGASRPDDDGPDRASARFLFDVDDITYEHNRARITGGEIMAMAGISPSDGLIQVLPDGSRKTVASDEVVRLVPGAQFKRRPRFKRG
jgi:hypothetical protein